MSALHITESLVCCAPLISVEQMNEQMIEATSHFAFYSALPFIILGIALYLESCCPSRLLDVST